MTENETFDTETIDTRRIDWQIRRMENGLCSICGKEPLAPKSRYRGEMCLEKDRERSARRREGRVGKSRTFLSRKNRRKTA